MAKGIELLHKEKGEIMDLREIKQIGVLIAILLIIVISIIFNKYIMPRINKKIRYVLYALAILIMIGSIVTTYSTIFF